jgi:predicted ATP-dependent serine protease
MLYSREMTASSVKLQMKRYAVEHRNAYVADNKMCPSLESFIEELNEVLPKVVIIDSLQVIMKEDYPNESAESCAFRIIQELRAWTEKNDAVLIIVGHVNKDGEFEGRNTIQHMFDSHLEMIFDKKKGTRVISWAKNRKGKVNNVLYYEFGVESIDFYTPEQFQTIKNNKCLDDYMIEMIKTFMGSLDKKNKNYVAFKKEFKKEIDKLYDSDAELFELNIRCMLMLKNLLKKYEF